MNYRARAYANAREDAYELRPSLITELLADGFTFDEVAGKDYVRGQHFQWDGKIYRRPTDVEIQQFWRQLTR